MAGSITKLDAGSTVAHGRSDYIAVHGHRGTTNINVIAMVGMMVDIQMYVKCIIINSVWNWTLDIFFYVGIWGLFYLNQ